MHEHVLAAMSAVSAGGGHVGLTVSLCVAFILGMLAGMYMRGRF